MKTLLVAASMLFTVNSAFAFSSDLEMHINQAMSYISGSNSYNAQCPKILRSKFHKININTIETSAKNVLGNKYANLHKRYKNFWKFHSANDCLNFYQTSKIGADAAFNAFNDYMLKNSNDIDSGETE